jgi:O-antigen/teichoic acid export membrane protein
VLTPGFVQPLEQEVGRAVAHRRAQGRGSAPVIRRAAVMAAGLALLTIIACCAAAVPLVDRVFHGNEWLFLALLLGILAYCAAYVGRGTLSGNGRFGPYGVMLGSDGVIRVAAAAVLALIGVRSPAPYGFAVALPAAVALLVALRGQRHLLEPGPQASYSELSTALGWLVLGSVLTQALSYSAYISAIALETPADSNRVGNLAAGILIARIPLLLFGAVQAALLPRLAGLAGAGHEDEFRSALRRLLMIVVAVGLVGVVGSFTIGHAVGRLLFGAKFGLANCDLGLLAIGSAAYIFATALAQALLALRSYTAAAMAWLAGCAGFVVVVALGNDLYLRSELGYGAGALVSALVMLGCLAVRLRSGVSLPIVEPAAELLAGHGHVVPES